MPRNRLRTTVGAVAMAWVSLTAPHAGHGQKPSIAQRGTGYGMIAPWVHDEREGKRTMSTVGTVTSVQGNLCWRTYSDGESLPFIWRFRDGKLNNLHSWPNKGDTHP